MSKQPVFIEGRLEPPEEQPELIATWTVTYEQLSVEQQSVALFTDGRSRVNDQ